MNKCCLLELKGLLDLIERLSKDPDFKNSNIPFWICGYIKEHLNRENDDKETDDKNVPDIPEWLSKAVKEVCESVGVPEPEIHVERIAHGVDRFYFKKKE